MTTFGRRLLFGLCATTMLAGQAATAWAAEPPGRGFPLPFSPDLPYDVSASDVGKLDNAAQLLTLQRDFDILSWQVFLALNWPAGPNGDPDRNKSIGDTTGNRVWDYWMPAQSVFKPDGAHPNPWDAGSPQVKDAFLVEDKAAWRQDTTDADENFQAFSGPLVDQNGKWVRYSVAMDHEEYDYIVDNVLYNLDGQIAFSQKPDNNQIDFPADDAKKNRHGAIEIKLSWKQLGDNDDRSRFFVQHIKVVKSEPHPVGQQPPTEEFDAGLVGMHISMRTRSSPEWIWATFEQVDNVRSNPMPGGKFSHPNFFNPDAKAPGTEIDCKTGATRMSLLVPVNQLSCPNARMIDPKTNIVEPEPDPTKATTWIEHLTTTPVQVVRTFVPNQGYLNEFDARIAESTGALNQQVEKALAQSNSVFQYYELIGTQWPFHANAPAFAGGEGSAPESITHKTPGDMVPVFLVNTSTETFFMKGDQPAGPLEQDDRLANTAPPIDSTHLIGTESCVGCHYSAGAAVGWKHNADGSIMTDPATGKRTPIFGENSHFGKTGNGAFSWLLQIQAKEFVPPPTTTPAPAALQASSTPAPALAPPLVPTPARFLDNRLLKERHKP